MQKAAGLKQLKKISQKVMSGLLLTGIAAFTSGAQFVPVPVLPLPAPGISDLRTEIASGRTEEFSAQEKKPLWADEFESRVRSYRAVSISA